MYFQTHLTRHGNFGFKGNTSWFGIKSKLENLLINNFITEAESHDAQMEKVMKILAINLKLKYIFKIFKFSILKWLKTTNRTTGKISRLETGILIFDCQKIFIEIK